MLKVVMTTVVVEASNRSSSIFGNMTEKWELGGCSAAASCAPKPAKMSHGFFFKVKNFEIHLWHYQHGVNLYSSWSLVLEKSLKNTSEANSQCLKITQNLALECWYFSSFFVRSKVTSLVTLFDRKFHVFKMNHFWWTFVHSQCKRSSLRSQCWMRLILWFSNTVNFRIFFWGFQRTF